jgi:hypothetical protein
MQSIQRIAWSLVASLVLAGPVFAESVTFDYSVETKQGFLNNGVPNTVTLLPFGGQETVTVGTLTVYPALAHTGLISSPGSFVHQPIWVTVNLTDGGSGAPPPGPGSVPSGAVTFNGTLSSITFNSGEFTWNYAWTASTQAITLGSPGQFHTYVVGAPTYATNSDGILTATIPIQVNDYQPGIDPAPVVPTPEPASLLLAVLGLPAVVAVRRTSRKAR